METKKEETILSRQGYISKYPLGSNPKLGLIKSDTNGEYPFLSSNIHISKEFWNLLQNKEEWPNTLVEFDVLSDEPGKRKTTNLRIKSKQKPESKVNTQPQATSNKDSADPIKGGALTADQRKNVLIEIRDNWKQEGSEEDSKYFYHREDIKTILNGDKYYVIGRKGSGKSAIANYLEKLPENDHTVFAKKLTLKDLPDYKSKKKNVLEFESECLLLLYKSFYDIMMGNDSINHDKLDKAIHLVAEDPITGGLLLGKTENDNENISLKNQCDIYKKAILENADSSCYYLSLDELDIEYASYVMREDSNFVEEHANFESYINLLSGLFIAIRDFKELLRNEKGYSAENKKFFPILFLRDDILDQILHSDRSKWTVDHGFTIDWNIDNIKKLIAFRLSKSISPVSNYTFDYVWPLLFSKDEVSMGNKSRKKKNSFNFICDLTQMRPRDFITYISQCARYELESTSSPNNYLIKADTVRKIGKTTFSNILRSDIEVEIQILLPDYKEIFGLITKQCFTLKEFEGWYNEAIKENYIKNKMPIKKILEILFAFNVIGRQNNAQLIHSDIIDGKTIMEYSTPAIFKYMNKNVPLILSERFYVHRGLFAAFSIY